LSKPATYLITSGETTAATTPGSKEFQQILKLVRSAVAARIDLIQLREKRLTVRVLQQLAVCAAEITRGTGSRLLINDRADVAVAAGADGVHLTSESLPASIVRRTFGSDLLIGVSTHSLAEARAAQQGADFALFGPVFFSPAKAEYGPAVGLEQLEQVCAALKPFPVIAIGGIDEQNVSDCLCAGASGVAAIRMFSDTADLAAMVNRIADAKD
ncbi:MAG TPA: thiamine phosphate synthase, partial [Pyrinomonadaceae bacterium]|nr:thiamine phosphate synthase [Pyrinomonadaceae bacterium]